jgi:probable HAF family extracellular repeat protein
MRTHLGLFVGLCGALVTVQVGQAISAYTCSVFEVEPETDTRVTGINNRGQVVGTWTTDNVVIHAFLRNPDGTIESLYTPDGSDNFTPVGTNNRGQIAGPSFILNRDGSYIDVPPAEAPPGHTYETPEFTGFNDRGQLAGSISADPTPFGTRVILAFIRHANGEYQIIDQSGAGTYPTLIVGPLNNAGSVIEHTRDSDGYLRKRHGMKIPLVFPGLPFVSGVPGGSTHTGGLNNSKTMAGHLTSVPPGGMFLRTRDGHYPAIVCPELPNASQIVTGLNDKNEVAGNSFHYLSSGKGLNAGFIATPTGVVPKAQLSNQNWTFAAHPPGETSETGRVYLSNCGKADLHLATFYVGDTGQTSDETSSFTSRVRVAYRASRTPARRRRLRLVLASGALSTFNSRRAVQAGRPPRSTW